MSEQAEIYQHFDGEVAMLVLQILLIPIVASILVSTIFVIGTIGSEQTDHNTLHSRSQWDEQTDPSQDADEVSPYGSIVYLK